MDYRSKSNPTRQGASEYETRSQRQDVGRTNGSDHERPLTPRATRVAQVLVGFIDSAADVKSVEGLCRVASIGVAPTTWRRWCTEEQIRPAQALDFARLIRALTLAKRFGAPPSEWMDMDPRTYRRVMKRGNVTDLFGQTTLPSTVVFIDRQRFIANTLVLDQVLKACRRAGILTTD